MKYSGKDIQVLTGIQAIRKRPNLYLVYEDKRGPSLMKVWHENKYAHSAPKSNKGWRGGTSDPHSLTRLIIEAMCLSRAFAAAGEVSEIEVKITNGTEVLIADNGPGFSMEKHPSGKTLIESLMTELHACKKLKHEDITGYCDSGIVVVNALSKMFGVNNVVDGLAHIIYYEKGELTNGPFIVMPGTRKGLALKFIFDPEIFGDLKIDNADLIAEIENLKPLTSAKIILSFDN